VDGPDSSYAHKIHFGRSGVFYAWNRLDDAMASIEQCSRLCQQWRDVDLQAARLVRLAQLEHARGNAEMAQEAICAAEELIHSHQLSPRWSLWVESALARLWLDQGKAEKALFLLRSSGVWTNASLQDAISHPGIFLVDEISYRLEPVYLILLRLFLVQGNPNAVLNLCKRLLPMAETRERRGRETELLILQALAFQAKKELPGALEALTRAISLAEPEQSTRVFIDEGEPMAKLLFQAKAHQIGGTFISDLLSFWGRPAGKEPSSAQPFQNLLVEPLSARELEVLKCIAEGDTNQEIADQFVISPKTVKRYISNIYGKLEAKNRTQAVSIARELKIL
jgi:LuxR family maltose regulon positive regulatory protein